MADIAGNDIGIGIVNGNAVIGSSSSPAVLDTTGVEIGPARRNRIRMFEGQRRPTWVGPCGHTVVRLTPAATRVQGCADLGEQGC
jgi:hypothetical protein